MRRVSSAIPHGGCGPDWVDEHHVEVSYSTVRAYVARRRPEILIEAGRALEEGFVPQNHPSGAEAEVDSPICGSTYAGPVRRQGEAQSRFCWS